MILKLIGKIIIGGMTLVFVYIVILGGEILLQSRPADASSGSSAPRTRDHVSGILGGQDPALDRNR